MALAELYGLLGRVDAAKDLFRRSLARGGVDLQEFPIYFGTDRKRDNNQPRIAFGGDRDPGGLTLGVTHVVVPKDFQFSTSHSNQTARRNGNAVGRLQKRVH